MAESYDVLVIGAGQAGPPLAQALARAGRRVALAEEAHLGGSCVNFGCTPTKAVIASAQVAHLARRAAEYGVLVSGVEVDFAAVLTRAKAVVMESRAGLERSLADLPQLARLSGHAQFAGRDGDRFLLTVDDRPVEAREVVLNTGTRATIPPIPGLDDIDYLDADHWLDRHDCPSRLLLVGGGYVGLEMAQFYGRMGSEVIVVESGPRIAEHEDEEVASLLQERLAAEGIEFRLEARSTGFRRGGRGAIATVESKGAADELDVSHVLMATGRTPNTDRLGLDTVGVKLGERGMVEVDERLATSVKGIWACGDIRGGPMFTHTAWDDYRVLESQMLGDGKRTTAGRIVPYAMFTDPELGRVGLTERAAREAGIDVRVARFELKHNGKAREVGETVGFVKVVADARTKRFVGASLVGAHASELVHLVIDVMNADAPWSTIVDAIHIHPTLAEAVQSAVTRLDDA